MFIINFSFHVVHRASSKRSPLRVGQAFIDTDDWAVACDAALSLSKQRPEMFDVAVVEATDELRDEVEAGVIVPLSAVTSL